MKKALITIFFILGSINIFAQNVLTNSIIVNMTKADLGNEIIINKIHSSKCAFNVEIDSLLYLKKSGVSKEVINAMMDASQNVKKNVANKDNPEEPHRSGIYYYSAAAKEGKKVLRIEPAAISQNRSSAAPLIYGIVLTSHKIALDGTEARMVVNENKPMFYFYFVEENDEGENLNSSAWSKYKATSPNQFSLVKLIVDQSKNVRKVETESGSNFSSNSGISSKYKIKFMFDQVNDSGIYKVFFDVPLEPGEYAFMYIGAGTSSGSNPPIFDFSVK